LIFSPQLLYNAGLAPENPVPAQYEDVAAAYTHVVKDLGISSTKIIIGTFPF
jgi:acetyl esterase/lipase